MNTTCGTYRQCALALMMGAAAALLAVVMPAHAFDPAVPTAEDLFNPDSRSVVLGRFVPTKTDPAVFVVEESLRGNVPTGQYTVFETGRISLEGDPAVFAVARPDRHFPPGLAVLPIVEIDHINHQLVLPMATAWRFRVSKDRVTDELGFSTRFDALVQALRAGAAFPAWVPVKPARGR